MFQPWSFFIPFIHFSNKKFQYFLTPICQLLKFYANAFLLFIKILSLVSFFFQFLLLHFSQLLNHNFIPNFLKKNEEIEINNEVDSIILHSRFFIRIRNKKKIFFFEGFTFFFYLKRKEDIQILWLSDYSKICSSSNSK